MASSVIRKPDSWIGTLRWDSTIQGFPTQVQPRDVNQYTVLARNRSTGAIYVLWYDVNTNSFRIGSTISGSAPTGTQAITVSYPI